MKKVFAIASVLFALSHSAEGQNNIVYGAGVSYTNGTPTYSPGTRGAQIAIDTVTGYWYEYRTETSAWVHAGYRIQTIAGCAAPGYAPGKKQSLLVVNSCDSLYYYRSSAWRHLNPPGGGGDPSITNEGILGVSAGGANTAVITSNTSTAVGVNISGSNTILVTESTSANGGTVTLQADTSLLATLNDLNVRLIVDTVNDYTALRAYAGTAPIVFVRKNGIEGFFKVVTGGWVDDAGITIVGTKKFRRIAENLRIVNVKWFGAVGDSTTSDETAKNLALSWCKDSIGNIGSTLYFPAGRFRYTTPISYYKPVNFSIKGDGMHNTYLFPVNVTGIAIRTDSTATLYYGDFGVREGRDFHISDLSLMRVGTNTFDGKIYGLDLRGGFNKRIENISVRNYFASAGTGMGSVGIRLLQPFGTDAVQHTIFDNVYVSSCDTGIVSRLQNTMQWRSVKIDACKRVGLRLSNSLFWDGGLCQANQNCGVYLKNSDPSVLNEVTIQGVHFEGNAYVAPKWGGIYKPDNVDMTDLNIHDCLMSSPGGTHMLRLKRVQYSWISNNRWSGNATTDTISLTSVYNVYFGNDNYTSLKLITSDCYVNWLNGSGATVASLVGMTIGTAAAGVNYMSAGGGISVGDTYYSIVAPTDGAIIKGKVGIKNSSPQRDLDVNGEARIRDLTTDASTDLIGADADGDLSRVSASTGLLLSAGVLTALDPSATNEAWTIDADDADTEVISNQTVKFQGAGIAVTDYNPTTDVLLITATEVDGSTSNELQTFGHSGTTSYTNTLSAGGGSFTLQSGGIVSISHTAGTVTISATEVDGSTTNELQTLANTSGATTHTATLSNSGGSVQLVEGSGITLTTTGTGLDGIVTFASSAAGTLTAAENGLYVSGTTVRMGTNPLIEATLIDQDANDMRFYDGKWSYTSWTTSWTPTQGFGIQGTENSPTTASSPTQDGVAEFRVLSSGGSAQPNSLTFGGYATDADGVWMQSRSHSNPSVEYPLSAQPRGGQFSVGRLTGLDALVTFSSTGLAGSTAAGSVLHLENVEGNQKAAMSVGVAAGTDVVDGEFAYFDATDILRVTQRNTTVGTSSLRFAVGGETSDRVTIVESSTTPNARMGVGTTAPISTLQSGGSLAAACVTFTGALTLDERHYRVEYTGTTAVTITLPTAANASQRMYVIHHRGTAGTITLSIAINKGNGATFNTLTAGQHVFIHSDGSAWNGIKLNSL